MTVRPPSPLVGPPPRRPARRTRQIQRLGPLVAFFGTINPQSGDAGMLVPLEHAMLARGVADAERTRAFARYSLTGALATAAGSLAAATPDLLVAAGLGRIASFQMMFYAYAALGAVGAALYRRLPRGEAAQTASSTPLGPSRWTVSTTG